MLMAINKELLKGTAKTLVLQLLSEREMHGYELLTKLKEKSKNLIEITEGTLYPLLHTLEEDGFLTASWEKGASNRKRKVYAITPDGKKSLAIRSQELKEFVSVIQRFVAVKFLTAD